MSQPAKPGVLLINELTVIIPDFRFTSVLLTFIVEFIRSILLGCIWSNAPSLLSLLFVSDSVKVSHYVRAEMTHVKQKQAYILTLFFTNMLWSFQMTPSNLNISATGGVSAVSLGVTE